MRFNNTEQTPLKFFNKEQNDATSLVMGMYSTLKSLYEGKVPNSEYSRDDLKTFLDSMLDNRTQNPCCWNLENSFNIPNEAQIFGIYFPSYIAISILTIILNDYEELISNKEDFLRVYFDAISFCGTGTFWGHGYDAIDTMIDAVKILHMGRIPETLLKFNDRNEVKGLLKELKTVKDFTSECLASGNTRGGWDENYTEEYKHIQAMLKDI